MRGEEPGCAVRHATRIIALALALTFPTPTAALALACAACAACEWCESRRRVCRVPSFVGCEQSAETSVCARWGMARLVHVNGAHGGVLVLCCKRWVAVDVVCCGLTM
jgi:hypothetical protein